MTYRTTCVDNGSSLRPLLPLLQVVINSSLSDNGGRRRLGGRRGPDEWPNRRAIAAGNRLGSPVGRSGGCSAGACGRLDRRRRWLYLVAFHLDLVPTADLLTDSPTHPARRGAVRPSTHGRRTAAALIKNAKILERARPPPEGARLITRSHSRRPAAAGLEKLRGGSIGSGWGRAGRLQEEKTDGVGRSLIWWHVRRPGVMAFQRAAVIGESADAATLPGHCSAIKQSTTHHSLSAISYQLRGLAGMAGLMACGCRAPQKTQ